jgi:orotate phosphoribosyltransferase-like protein
VASGGTFGTTIGDSVPTSASNTATFSADRSVLLASVAASTAVSVSWSTSTVGSYTISVYRSSATANIAGLTDTTDGDLIGGITVSVVSSATAAELFSLLRAQIATSAPAAAKPLAHPNPIPPLPPVITASFPVRSKSWLEVNRNT